MNLKLAGGLDKNSRLATCKIYLQKKEKKSETFKKNINKKKITKQNLHEIFFRLLKKSKFGVGQNLYIFFFFSLFRIGFDFWGVGFDAGYSFC